MWEVLRACGEELLVPVGGLACWGGALLDLLFTDREGLVGDVEFEGCLGNSDCETIEFSEGHQQSAKIPHWTSERQTLAYSRDCFG